MELNHRSNSTPVAAGAGRSALRALTGVAVGGLASFAAHAANCADAPVSGKNYSIVNEASGLALDVLGWSQDDGADIIQYQSNGAANQQWTATKVADGSWSLRPVHSSQKSMDVYGWQTGDNTPLKQWTYKGATNQLFALRATSNGTVNIVSNYSNKLVTVGDGNALSKIYQDSDRSSAKQRWYFNPVDGKCSGAASGSFSNFMGSTKMLIGAQMADASGSEAPFDVRYRYLASLPMPDDSYAKKCPTTRVNWWACWDSYHEPAYDVKGWIQQDKSATWQNAAHPRMTMFTYYVMKSAANYTEGEAELVAMNNAATLNRYLADWRFLLQTIGNERVILQIEPDLWGFVRGKNKDPHAVPAQVTAANPTDCAYQENSAAGLGRCMIAMARKYAPHVAVGLHASSWNHTQSGNAEEIGNYMLALGAGNGDFVSTDPSDRDAGWYKTQGQDTFWTDQSFAAYLAWSKKLAEVVGKSTVMWQIPLGNWQQNNTTNHWQDNKVDYLFNNLDKVADAHIAGLFFGAGDTPQTSPESDGGRLFGWTQGYYKKGGVGLR